MASLLAIRRLAGFSKEKPAADNEKDDDLRADVLEDFSYWYINESSSPATVTTYLYSWNGSAPTGQALYSDTVNLSSNSGIDPVTYSDIGVTLTPGAQYVMLTESPDNNSVVIYYDSHGGASSSQYNMVEDSNGSYTNFSGYSLDFTATFDNGASVTPVPETASLLWAGVALCAGLAGWQYFRHRAATASLSV